VIKSSCNHLQFQFEELMKMHSKAIIGHTLGMSDFLMNAYIADLTEDEMFIQPVAGMNHIAWQIGHLISAERGFAEMISPGASPTLPSGFDDVHSRTDTKGTTREQFLNKEAYLNLYKAQRAATLGILESASDELLATATTDRYAQIAPSYGALLNMIGLHYMMHLGQFVAVRRTANKPIAV
jgi:hypothetical protein